MTNLENTEQKIKQQLQDEGFTNIVMREDPANKNYPDHTHDFIAAHIILEGEMNIKMNGESNILKAGDRLDIPREVIHEVIIGDDGCKFIVGEK